MESLMGLPGLEPDILTPLCYVRDPFLVRRLNQLMIMLMGLPGLEPGIDSVFSIIMHVNE